MPRNKRNRRKSTSSGDRLPKLIANAPHSLKARYGGLVPVTAGSETIYTITAQDLCAAGGVLASGAHTCWVIHQSVRIKKVSMWLACPSNTSISPIFNSISLVWYNALTGTANVSSGKVESDSSLSLSAVPKITSSPPKDLSSMWLSINAATNPVFDIIITGETGNYGLMVDVDLEMLFSNQSFSATSFTTAATLSTGTVYYTPLDGVTGHILLRQALPSTF